MRLQRISGTLELGGPTINFLDYSCFSPDLPLAVGEHEFEVVTFTPSVAGVYTFFLGADFSSNFSLYQGSFNVENPCANLMQSMPRSYPLPLPAVLPLPEDFLSYDLRANETYSLLISNELSGGVGDWELVAYHEGAGTLSGFDDPMPHPLLFDLLLTDTSAVYFATPQQWIVGEDGSLDTTATLTTFFGGNEILLHDFLVQLNYTGLPTVSGDCGPMIVRLSDELNEGGACEALTITRTFEVQTLDENCTPTMASCQQVISFRLPSLADVQWPAYSAKVQCDEGFSTDGETGGPDDNPSVAAVGRPMLLSFAGHVELDSSYLNLSASYMDEPRIVVCEGSYKYRRQWSLEDACTAEGSLMIPQLVTVADEVGPVFVNLQDTIRISTSPFSCIANFVVPVPEVTDGNGCSSAYLSTYTILIFGESFFAGGNIADGDVAQLPIAEYLVISCTEDDCGNETCEETVLIVADDIPPTADCNFNMPTILIGGGDVSNGIEGIARVFPEDVDTGSADNCGEVTLELRRNYWRNNTCDLSGNRWSPWGPHVDFYCCDIGEDVTIELRVTDEGGLQSVCWTVVEIDDTLAPYCYAPAPESFTCEEAPAGFPEDIEAAYANDFRVTSILMNSLFGGATSTDNCAVDTIVELQPLFQLNDCGWGTITRRFEAWQLRPEGDVNGNWAIDINEVYRSTNNCTQLITVQETHHFVIDFPQDAVLDCGAADLPGVVTTTMGCDVLAINTGDPISLLPTGDECYQLSITYDVINWCVWDGSSEGWEIPRLTEDDGEPFGTGFGVEAAERPVLRITSDVGPDDENCDGILSTNENGTDDATDIRYFLLLDRNHPDVDGDSSLPDAQYDNVAETPAGCVPADGDGVQTYGRFRYTQLVKVLNNLSIDIEVVDYGGPTIYCPDLAPGQFGDEDGDCEEEVSISFAVREACGVFENVSLAVNILSAELDAFAVDTDGDGTISPEEFSAEAGSDGDVLSNIALGSDGTYTLAGIFPVITAAMGDSIYHAVQVLLEDGCGNQIEKTITFDVIDCVITAPICNVGLNVYLEPLGDGTCGAVLQASDLIASPFFDCNGQGPEVDQQTGLPMITTYAVYLASEIEADPNPTPDSTHTSISLTEDSEAVTVVYVYAFDEEGNYNYCETYVLILPYCHAPAAVSLSCEDMPAGFPADIEAAYANDFEATSVLMNSLFGEATSTEGCAVDTIVELQPLFQLNDCGWGTITRRFEAWQLRPAGDVNGNGTIDVEEVVRSTNNCTQPITVQETHHFMIDFPQDAVLDCDAADLPGVVTTTMGCDVLAINTGDPISLLPTGDECYQLSITYDVINWCVWDGSSEGWEIPRLTEDDGELFGTGFGVEAAERPVLRITSDVGPDDENCDGILSTDENGTDDAADIRYFLLLDRNHPDVDGDSSLPDAQYDNVAETLAGCIPADGDGVRIYGRFRYTQLVKVLGVDSIGINVPAFGGPTANCPDLLPGQFGDDDGNCEQGVSITFSVGTACGLFADELSTSVSIVSAQLDAFAIDTNGDNVIQPNEFIAEMGDAGNVIANITSNNDETYTFAGTYPIITPAMGEGIYHALMIVVEDVCGNQSSEVITFDVVDCKAPAPICNNGLTFIMEPLGDGTCGAIVQASNFIASPIYDCSGQGPAVNPQTGLPIITTYAVYLASEVEADPDFQPDATHTSITLTEEDEATTVVYIYAFDEEGNYDYCETYLTLAMSTECTLDLAGVIFTKDNETIEGVEVYLSGSANLVDETDADGYYHFGNLDFGGNFTLIPYRNSDPANGVNTIDMILLLKHINGTAPLQNPFELIAADVDGSGDITMADFDILRQLLLGNIGEFPNNYELAICGS
ncbi:hypothetical protein [Lewinella sp. LCG006]|uniref:hypothetical protein n=1 Tax=Lewinella sp. LCG006 TaxID=3231911 RepID=UPI00346050B3